MKRVASLTIYIAGNEGDDDRMAKLCDIVSDVLAPVLKDAGAGLEENLSIDTDGDWDWETYEEGE